MSPMRVALASIFALALGTPSLAFGQEVPAAAGLAGADATDAGEVVDEAESPKAVEIGGYIQPQFGMRYRPGAVPRDRTDYSGEQARAGLTVVGKPIPTVGYDLHVSVAVGAFSSGTEQAEAADISGVSVDRAAVDWDPTPHIGISVGQMRIPFTVEGQISNTELMFPNRSAASDVFVQGSDIGALARLAVRDKKMRITGGVFNGTTPTTASEASASGPLFSLRADIDPMGQMENGGRDTRGGDVRFGFGAGVVYYPSTSFDEAGFAGTKMRDLRGALSVRAAFKRIYFQAEVMRRQRTDSLSNRPLIATGGYGQGSYYVPLKDGIALSPIGRIGWTVEDKSFDPRETLWTEAGATLHFRGDKLRADDLQLTLQYLGEHRLTERESAHGLVAQLRLRW